MTGKCISQQRNFHIHQELVLVPHMTVAENIFLGREPSKGLWVSHETMEKEAQQLLDTYHEH